MQSKEGGKTSSEFVIARTFNAPRDLVFQMWTDPKHLKNWLPPNGMSAQYVKADIRPGGVAHYYMETPGGKMWGKVLYREISKPTRLVYVQCFSDEKEGISTHPMMPTWPREMLTTVAFKELGDKTEITLTWVAINASEVELSAFEKSKSGMNQGWSGSFDQLDRYISTLKGT